MFFINFLTFFFLQIKAVFNINFGHPHQHASTFIITTNDVKRKKKTE